MLHNLFLHSHLLFVQIHNVLAQKQCVFELLNNGNYSRFALKYKTMYQITLPRNSERYHTRFFLNKHYTISLILISLTVCTNIDENKAHRKTWYHILVKVFRGSCCCSHSTVLTESSSVFLDMLLKLQYLFHVPLSVSKFCSISVHFSVHRNLQQTKPRLDFFTVLFAIKIKRDFNYQQFNKSQITHRYFRCQLRLSYLHVNSTGCSFRA